MALDGSQDGISPESLDLLANPKSQISFGDNPHREGSKKAEIFEKCRSSKSIGMAKEMGASNWDLREWFKKSALYLYPEGRPTSVKKEALSLSPEDKVKILENRKRYQESQSRSSSADLSSSPAIASSPASKHLRFDDHIEVMDISSQAATGKSSHSSKDQSIPAGVDPTPKKDDQNFDMTSIMTELRSINERLNSVATKSDLQQNLQDTKVLISEAVDPIKNEVHDLRKRQDAVEQSLSQSSSSNLTGLSPEVFQIMNQSDVAQKQISLIGFPDSLSASRRLEVLSSLISTHFSNIAGASFQVGNFYSGPRSNRKLTSAAYVELPNTKIAEDMLKALKDSPHLQLDGYSLKARAALTLINKKRNWALREAEKLAKNLPEGNNAKIIWNERKVKSGDIVIFGQEKYDLTGTFYGAFSHLRLP